MAFDEVSSPVLAKKFSAPDFNPDEYVRTVLASDIYRSLYEQRNNIKMLGEETAVSLRKNVYRNYRQFIDTAKEISYLEAEMYQLSHMLTEQKSTLTEQIETDIFERPKGLPVQIDPAVEAYQLKKKTFLESIKASKQQLSEFSVKELLFDGDLTEFDPETYSSLQRVNSFLLTDILLITSLPSHGKSSILKLFDLADLAVVNVRDGQGVKNAFKILYSLETRMFGAPSKELKLAWLDQIERAKKNYRKGVQIESEKLAALKKQEAEEEEKKKQEEEIIEDRPPVIQRPNLLNVDWLIELPEDLDMSIAQRDFESAVHLVSKARAYLADFPESPLLNDIRNKVETRVQLLVVTLEKSLDNSSSSRHVSLRSIREFVLHLIRLEKEKLACDLFLRNRGYEIKNSFKQLKMEGATALFINKLASVFFTAVNETGREYKRTFAANKHASAFVVWVHGELAHFAEKFSRQVFTRNTSLSGIGVCMNIALKQCKRLECIGIDLTFDLQHMLFKDIMTAVFDTRDQLLEHAKIRAMEDKWEITNYEDDEEGLQDIVNELVSLGLSSFEVYVKEKTIMLSTSTVFFVKNVLMFLEDVLQLYTVELHVYMMQCLSEIFKAQTIQFESLLKDRSLQDKAHFILVNAELVYGRVLNLISNKLKSSVGHKLSWVNKAEGDLEKLRKLGPGQTSL